MSALLRAQSSMPSIWYCSTGTILLDCSITVHEPKSHSPKGWKLNLHSMPKLHNAIPCSKDVIWNRALEKKIISKLILLQILNFPICAWNYANFLWFPRLEEQHCSACLVPSCNICHNYIREEIACSLEKKHWCTKFLSGVPEHLNCMWGECLDFTCDKKTFFKASGKLKAAQETFLQVIVKSTLFIQIHSAEHKLT